MILQMGELNDKQKEFCRAKAKHVGFGGARGGGKSHAVRFKANILALRHPGITICIVRKTYPELMSNHINIMRPMLKGVATYRDRDKMLTFRNGSTIYFRYCSCDRDLDHFQGLEFDVVFFDEATMLSEFQLKSITACVRGVNEFPKRCYYTCNPNGIGFQYIKRIFVDKIYQDGENPEDYIFIRSLVTDNHYLLEAQPDYIRQLEALPPKLRAAWLYGEWNLEGAFFEEFVDDPSHYGDRIGTHVIDPFDIPQSWNVYRAFDWGYSRPFCALYIAVSTDGTAYNFLEYYGTNGTPNEGAKMTPDEVFSEMRKIEKEHPWLAGRKIIGVADPAIWDAQTGESIADTAAKHQIYFQKGDHKRVPGWMQVHYYLHMDRNNTPMIYFFKNCKNMIRTIQLMQYSDTKPDDLNTDLEDHCVDSLRYFCMARPIKAPVAVVDDGYKRSALAQIFDIPKGTLPPPRRAAHIEIIEED